jgi:hypothetical protein
LGRAIVARYRSIESRAQSLSEDDLAALAKVIA